MTDIELEFEETLTRARRMDSQALALIHDRFYPEVYRYVHYRLENVQVCEDITSEVFLRLLDALHKQRGPEQNLRGWLLGTASNLVNDHLRKKYAHPMDHLDEIEFETMSNGKTPEHSVETSWQQNQVRQAVQKLTHEQQHVLALRFAEERSLEETSKIIGKNVNAVKALQFRALASLRRFLDERMEK